jgi:hypothetical protein
VGVGAGAGDVAGGVEGVAVDERGVSVGDVDVAVGDVADVGGVVEDAGDGVAGPGLAGAVAYAAQSDPVGDNASTIDRQHVAQLRSAACGPSAAHPMWTPYRNRSTPSADLDALVVKEVEVPAVHSVDNMHHQLAELTSGDS